MKKEDAAILVVEDDGEIRSCICQLLDEEKIPSIGVPSLEEARWHLTARAIAGVILDYTLPDGTGADLLHEVSQLPDPPPVVLVSAHPPAKAIAARFGIPFIAKPYDLDVLLAAIRSLLAGEGRPTRERASRPSTPRSSRRRW